MTSSARRVPSHDDLLAQLSAALFRPMGVKGLRANTGLYEDVFNAISALLTRRRPKGSETLRFPPVSSRRQIEASGYLKTFPHLIGCVSCLDQGRFTAHQVAKASDDSLLDVAFSSTDLVLTPSTCYPLYPMLADEGAIPGSGRGFDIIGDCFRHEPSDDLDRLQSFRMREFVHIGRPAMVEAFREHWVETAQGILGELGLKCRVDVANDPFFCPGATFLAANQRARKLKLELLVEIVSSEKPTACISLNYHYDHFGDVWGLKTDDGEVAHSACIGIGMDRLTLALFVRHGSDLASWPKSVLETLQL